MKKNIKKYSIIKYTVCIILIISFIITGGYSYYGGLGTGKCANVNEFEKYAVTVEDISIPEQARIAIYQKRIQLSVYSALYRILPRGYRVWASPAELYDAMIYVSDAHPIEVIGD